MPEQQEEQGLEEIFKEIISENFPDVAKKKSHASSESPNRMNPNRPTPRRIIITMANIQDKERILKASRERQKVTYKEPLLDYQMISQQKHIKPEKNGKKSTK